MHKFLVKNHDHICLAAHISPVPIHLMAHYATLATIVAACVVITYVSAVVCHARARATA